MKAEKSLFAVRVVFLLFGVIVSILMLTLVFSKAQNQTVGGQVTIVSSAPTNCTLGTLFFNTNTNQLSVCKATDTLATVMLSPMRASTGTITGTSLPLGSCNTGTVTVTGATTSMPAIATPVNDPGIGIVWNAFVSSANTVTVKECALVLSTPNNTAYNVVVNP